MKLWNLSTTNIGLYIGLYLGVISGCLRTSSKKEPKGICLCKQATNVEDSSRTIVNRYVGRGVGAMSGKGVVVGPNAKITRSPDGHPKLWWALWHAVSYEAY